MHYHCEVIMPPTNDVTGAVEQIMAPFSEDNEDATHTFWDWWVIGGRWAGEKRMAKLDKSKLEEFYAWMRSEKVTVSSVRAGKDTLSPADQRGKVDAKWNEMFPSDPPIPCPIFDHFSDDQMDVCTVAEADGLTCARVVIGGPGYGEGNWDGPLEAVYMVAAREYNGVNFVDTSWDGTVASAIQQCRDHMSHAQGKYRESREPKDDWLVVTVDYHC